jgi:hypothetical protein
MDMIISKAKLAELFQVSVQAIDNWVRHGCPREDRGQAGNREAKFDLSKVLAWYKTWKDSNAYRKDLDISRTKLAAAQERRLDFDMAKLKREYLPAEMIERSWRDEILRFRAKMLGLSTRLAAPLAAAKDPSVVKAKIDEHVHDALAELGKPDELPAWLTRDTRDDRQGGTPRRKAAAKAQRKRVGRRKPKAKR